MDSCRQLLIGNNLKNLNNLVYFNKLKKIEHYNQVILIQEREFDLFMET